MGENPKVSIIIPTYNKSGFLKAAIHSVLSQSFKDFELIIIDDGSTDDTKLVVEEFLTNNRNIKYFWQENSGGAARPINFGFSKARGEYVAFLENDDEWLPQKLERQIALLENADPNAVKMVGCDAFLINSVTNTITVKKVSEIRNSDRKDFLKIVYGGDFMTTFTIPVIQKKLFEEIGGLDENLRFAADNDFFFRSLQKSDFLVVPEPLIKYNIYGQSLSNIVSKQKIEELRYLLKKHIILFESNPKIYSKRWEDIGGLYLNFGEMNQVRYFFRKAIKVYPLNLRAYFKVLIASFGKNFYLRISKNYNYIKKLASKKFYFH